MAGPDEREVREARADLMTAFAGLGIALVLLFIVVGAASWLASH